MENKEKSYSITFISMATILFLILVSSTASAATAQSASFAAPYAYITNYDSKNFFIIDTVTKIVTDIVDVGYSSAGAYNGNLIAPDEKGIDSKLATMTVLDQCATVLPVASFSSNLTEGYSPFSVQFTDLSEDATEWNWSFGDGNSSTEQNPEHTYSAAGTFNVNLTVSNSVGQSTKTGVINVKSASPTASYAYITNYLSNTVSVIDSATNNVTATVPVGSYPRGVAVNPEGTKVYVTNTGSNTVSVIDSATKNVTATVNLGIYPWGVAVNPEGTKVYVTNTGSNTVSAIDTATNTVIATVPVGTNPLGIAVNPEGTKVYAANIGSSTVSVIDSATKNVTATVNVGYNPAGVAVNPAGTKVYVTNAGSNTVSVIDSATNNVTATVPVGSYPWGVAVNPAGTKVYVANQLNNDVSVIDSVTNTVAATVNVGTYPNGVAVNPAGTKVYVANPGSNTVSAIDTATDTVTATVNVGNSPVAFGQFVGPLPAELILPVANFSTNVTSGYFPLTVYFTDLSEDATEWNWSFGDGNTSTEQNPEHTYSAAGTFNVNLTVSNAVSQSTKTGFINVKSAYPTASYAYITNYLSNTVSVIDTATNNVTAIVNVGSYPWGVAVNPTGTKVYVANWGSNTVSVIDAASDTVAATVNVGRYPRGLAVNPAGTKAYVANWGSNTVSVIDTATNNVTATLNVGYGTIGVAVNPVGTKVYVTNFWDKTVSVIDAASDTITATVNVRYGPAAVAVSPAGTKVYVTNAGNNTVSVIDTATNNVTATVPVGSYPWGVAVSPDGTKVYVANEYGNTVSVVDTTTNTITATISVGSGPTGVAVNPDGTRVYVANPGSNTVSAIDTATDTVTATVNVGNSPVAFGQFIVPPSSQLVLPVANFSSNVTSGYAPLYVQFTDLSQNATGINWSFGDGNTSNEQNPTHNYPAAGNYTVNLAVNNENGTDSKTAAITVLEESSSSDGSSDGSGDSSGGSSSGSSHSSSGGGSAVGSPEHASNVEVKEFSQAFITSGKEVKFDFPRNATCVVYVIFDAKRTVGKTIATVEMLKGKSTLVPGIPSDEVYKYLNIWVGNSGYGTENNIKNAVVCFKVEKSWLQNKIIDQSSITLNRYNDTKWNPLSINLSGEDGEYLYFTAETPGFSPFAITGKTAVNKTVNGIKPDPNSQGLKQSNVSNATNVEQTPEQTQNPNTSEEESTKTPGFDAVFGIVCLLAVFLHKRK